MVFYTRLSGYWHIEVANDDHAITAHDPQVREVFLKGPTYCIIMMLSKMHFQPLQSSKHQVHHSLKGHWWIAQAKWHDLEFEYAEKFWPLV